MLSKKLTDKILVIEDESKIRQDIVMSLEDSGFEMVQAENGQQGLEVFRKEKPDLVLTDLHMPQMGGIEFLDAVLKEAPQTPIIVTSNVDEFKEGIQALRLGAADYVMKPITDMFVVERSVSKALERSRLVEENRIYRQQLEAANQALKKNLDILEQDQEAGRSVQMRMLPEQNMMFGPYQFSHGVTPSLYLSGDFVDYFKINDQKFAFYIADVSGHGASSAFVTVLLKSLIALALTRYQIHDETTIMEPDNLLANIANEIHGAKLGKYLTCVYGVIDLDTNVLTYSIGGHYPNPILVEKGQSKFLEGKGFPVGIMKGAKYQNISIPFPVGAELVMFSDGITEILPEKELVDKEKHILSLTSSGDGSVDHFLTQLALKEKRALPDDVTMLVLKRVS